MINSIKFYNGYPYTILPKRTYSFTDRINVIIGPNGSGKSTILHSLASFTGCGDGGWSSDSKNKLTYRIAVDWDGKPIFFQNCYVDSGRSLLNPLYFDEHTYLRSTGEKRVGLINELVDYLEK